MNEGSGAGAWTGSPFDSMLGLAIRRHCAPLLGLEPHPDPDTYLGRINLRHHLNEGLSEIGGHIGYDVRPTARRRGHATAMLAAALPRAAELGIDQALVTCDAENTASRKVIEANGGVLEDERGGTLRYRVPTAR